MRYCNRDFWLNLTEMNLLSDTRAMISLVYRIFLCPEFERKEMIENDRQVTEASVHHYDEGSPMDLIGLMS